MMTTSTTNYSKFVINATDDDNSETDHGNHGISLSIQSPYSDNYEHQQQQQSPQVVDQTTLVTTEARTTTTPSQSQLAFSFWMLGLFNNTSYVIMLACAKSISEGGTALVFLANVVPAMIIKLTAPYWFDKVSYQKRIHVTAILMFASFAIVASSSNVAYQLLGVAAASSSCGLGEASLLALAGKCDAAETTTTSTTESFTSTSPSQTKQKGVFITCFSSGTGVAGIFGFFWKWFWNDWLQFTLSQTLWIATLLSFAYVTIYSKYLGNIKGVDEDNNERHQQQQSDSLITSSVEDQNDTCTYQNTPTTLTDNGYQDVPSDEEDNEQEKQPIVGVSTSAPLEIGDGISIHHVVTTSSMPDNQQQQNIDEWQDEYYLPNGQQQQQQSQVQHVHDMTTKQRLQLVLSLYPYMIPLFVVYAAEYALQSGTWTSIGFPVEDETSRDVFYEYSNWLYQVGVFISRSSGTIYEAPLTVLWIMPLLQVFNVIFFTNVAIRQELTPWYIWPFPYKFGLLLIPCFYVGLLGGGVYVNGYTRICKDLPLEHREFALATTSVGESFGIVVADITGLFLQSCLYQINNIEGAIVSCPLS